MFLFIYSQLFHAELEQGDLKQSRFDHQWFWHLWSGLNCLKPFLDRSCSWKNIHSARILQRQELKKRELLGVHWNYADEKTWMEIIVAERSLENPDFIARCQVIIHAALCENWRQVQRSQRHGSLVCSLFLHWHTWASNLRVSNDTQCLNLRQEIYCSLMLQTILSRSHCCSVGPQVCT